MIRQDYAGNRQAEAVAGSRRAPRRWLALSISVLAGLGISVLAASLLWRHQAVPPVQSRFTAAAPRAVALPPKQHSKYDFYRLLTRAKATSVQVAARDNNAQP